MGAGKSLDAQVLRGKSQQYKEYVLLVRPTRPCNKRDAGTCTCPFQMGMLPAKLTLVEKNERGPRMEGPRNHLTFISTRRPLLDAALDMWPLALLSEAAGRET